MVLGILCCALVTHCIDRKRPCGAKDKEQGDIRGGALLIGAIFFDVIVAITLVALGALVLRGRIKLPTEAGIGLLISGVGGIILLNGVIFAYWFKACEDRLKEQQEQGTGYRIL